MINDKAISSLCQKDKRLIHPFSEELLQSHSYDLTLGDRFILYHSRKSHDKFIIGESNIDNFCEKITTSELCIQPNDFVLGVTKQYFKLPKNITALVEGKSSIGRLGLLIHDAGFIDAGFEGTITLEIKNLNSFPIVVKEGMKIAQIIFFKVSLPQKAYGKRHNHYQGQVDVTRPNLDRIISQAI